MSAQPLKILWLTENYFPNRGGMAQSCDRILHGLRTAGVQIDLLHFTARLSPYTLKTEVGGRYLTCPVVEDESHTLNLAWNFLTRPGIAENYTHLVAFGGHLPLLAAPVFSAQLGIPLISMIRGNDFDAAVFSPKRSFVLERAFARSSEIWTVSGDKAHTINRIYPGNKAVFVPNGIDLEEWSPLPSNLKQAHKIRTAIAEPTQKVIGLFGHLKEKKGFNFLVESLVKAGGKEQVHLLVTGELQEKSHALLEESGISWTAYPFLDRHELLNFYPVCDLIAIPSFYDGMPNVLLEAMALGIPVLASRVDGMKDVLEPMENPLLFHPGDVEACARSLRKFLQYSAEELHAMGDQLKAEIETHYTSTKEIERYLKQIATLSNNHPQPH